MYLSPNVGTKTINLVQIRFFFNFRPVLKMKGSLQKKHANELSDKHGILKTRSIVSVAMFRRDRQENFVTDDLKCTANRNKSLSN